MNTTLRRIFKTGFLNFKRNGLVSFVSVLVTTIALSVILLFVLTRTVFLHSLRDIESKVDIRVTFIVGTQEDHVLSLKEALMQLPEVREVVYVSSEQELADFKARHANDYLTLQALEEVGSNPLGGSFNIKAHTALQYEAIAKFIETSDDPLVTSARKYISKMNYTDNKLIIDRLNTIVVTGQNVGTALVLLLILIAIVVTYNTIRLTIHYSREEIAIMRLVGASRAYTRGPFMVEGMLYGFIGAFFTILLFIPITYWVGVHLTDFLSINLFDYFVDSIFVIVPGVFLLGTSLGALSSFFAIRKYLKQ